MSRARRHWPASVIDSLWVSTHAVQRYIERGGILGKKQARAEQELRYAVADGINENMKISAERMGKDRSSFFLIRVLSAPQVTYALVEKGLPNGKFNYLVRTVFSAEQFETLGTEKLTTPIWDRIDKSKLSKLKDEIFKAEEQPKIQPEPEPEPEPEFEPEPVSADNIGKDFIRGIRPASEYVGITYSQMRTVLNKGEIPYTEGPHPTGNKKVYIFKISDLDSLKENLKQTVEEEGNEKSNGSFPDVIVMSTGKTLSCSEENLNSAILQLLTEGVTLNDITIYRRAKIGLQVKID